MAKAQDFTATLKDMMGAFPVDTAAFEGAFKNQAALVASFQIFYMAFNC